MNTAHEESYDGPATAGDLDLAVHLRGHFEPIDGRFHWYGRIENSEELTNSVKPGSSIELTTEHGSATGRVSDPDPWGRLRISGTGRPPF